MNRLDHIQKAQAELGQAIERITRAFDAIEHTEPDLGEDLKATLRHARDVEHFLGLLEEKEPCGDPDPHETAKEEAHNG